MILAVKTVGDRGHAEPDVLEIRARLVNGNRQLASSNSVEDSERDENQQTDYDVRVPQCIPLHG